MGHRVVIVESPAKVRTLSRILKQQFKIGASMGHVRDLPKTVMGVDIGNGFRPSYRVLSEKKKTLGVLQKLVEGAEEVFLATDPDREGEAIAWHLAETLRLKSPKRVEFNEITRSAVLRAFDKPREIDPNRVEAQQARRILDRLVGYELSPLLSKKVHRRGLSAGRVQSVALRMVCEREREIQAFQPQEYWLIRATLSPRDRDAPFVAVHPFGKKERMNLGDVGAAEAVAEATRAAEWRVISVKEARRERSPRPPLITSTLQQRASQRFGFPASRTMRIAQDLYEGKEIGEEGPIGLITYMRTDSVRVSAEAQQAARELVEQRYGRQYVPEHPPQYKSRRGAQEAHEAIRPTSVDRTPDVVKPYLSSDELKLYTLIWESFIASQMAPAVFDTATVDIQAADYVFRARGERVVFPGYMAVTGLERFRKPGDDNGEDNGEERDDSALPELHEGQVLDLRKLEPEQRFTQPPPRYTEASLVRALEEHGIGRPSTYAPTIEVLKRRRYAVIEDRHFVPTPLGFAVNDRLVAHFGDIVNTVFTAQMEEKLDSIERGEANWQDLLGEFYGAFHADVERAVHEMEDGRVEPVKTGEECPKCGKPLVVRQSKFGAFVGCSGYPECDYIKRDSSAEGSAKTEKTGEMCPECGKPLVTRRGRYGPFIGCSGYPDCTYIKREEAGDMKCEKCGRPMVKRFGPRGPFLGCSGYPECKNIVNLGRGRGQRSTKGRGRAKE